MVTRLFVVGFLTISLAVSSLSAGLLTDDAAALPGWSGSTNIDKTQMVGGTSYNFLGRVDWAVFDYDSFDDKTFDVGDYVYAYQFFNDADSEVTTGTFQVSLLPDIVVNAIGFDDDYNAGITPNNFLSFGDEAIFLWVNDAIDPGEMSSVVYIVSDSAPTDGFGFASGNPIGGEIVNIPVPVPEPATVVILLAGAGMVLCRKA